MPVSRAQKWDALTPKYRARLERGGITRDAYVRGESVQAARGHARTPERPERAAKNPERFADYVAKRAGLPNIDSQVVAHARRIFAGGIADGEINRFDVMKVTRYVNASPYPVKVRMLGMTLDEWREAARADKTRIEVVSDYDEEQLPVNPFWYH